jgi:hypothetical protein
VPLKANDGLSFMGVIVVGQRFVVEQGDPLRHKEPGARRPYLVGKELNQQLKNRSVIDFFGQKCRTSSRYVSIVVPTCARSGET